MVPPRLSVVHPDPGDDRAGADDSRPAQAANDATPAEAAVEPVGCTVQEPMASPEAVRMMMLRRVSFCGFRSLRCMGGTLRWWRR